MNPLADDEVRIKLVSVAEFGGEALDSFVYTLSDNELQRVGRLATERQRAEFIVSHGVLRKTLGDLLNVSPADVVITGTRHEKPRIASPPDSGIEFSMSHSDSNVLYAFAMNRRVGIDIERINPAKCDAAIAQRVFSPAELSEWVSLPRQLKVRGFFRCWTGKEAFIKAVGLGTALDLKSFSVTVDPRKPAAVIAPKELSCQPWGLHALKLVTGFKAAVVVEGAGYRLVIDQSPRL